MNKFAKHQKFLLLVNLGLLLIIPFTRGSATEVWSENFDSGVSEELSLFAWTLSDGGVFTTNNTAKPTIVEGALQMPNTREWGTWSCAQRNTTLAYGTWSFDFTVKEGNDHTACFAVFFVSDMPWNQSGHTFGTLGLDGYFVALKSGSTDNVWGSELDHNMNLGEHYGNSPSILANHQFPDDVTGTHHIDITRALNGSFRVYFDSALIISARDTSTTISEVFIIGSWAGDVSFDNIVISDSIDVIETTTTTTTTTTTNGGTPGFELGIGVLSIVLVLISSQKRKIKI
jgi:hypothetical protein